MTDDLNNCLVKIRATRKVELDSEQREKLSKGDLKRFDKLTAILNKLQTGEKVCTSMLKRWLGDSYAEIAHQWEDEKATRDYFSDVPSELKRYAGIVKKAQFYENRSNYYSNRRKSMAAQKMHNKAELHYEKALEALSELLAADQSLQFYLDRTVSFEPDSDIGLSATQVPRLITSRSIDKNFALKSVQSTKHDLKIGVVERELIKIAESVRDKDVEKHSEKLKKLLRIPGFDDDTFN